jgi:quercetin dioxygenase-like cupin family protein
MTTGTVKSLNINDLKKYSPDARVNQPLMESKDFVTRMNCYEPGQVTPFHVHPQDAAPSHSPTGPMCPWPPAA